MKSKITPYKKSEAILKARSDILEFSYRCTLDQLLQRTLDEIENLTGSNIGFFHFVEPDQITLSLQTWSTNTLQKICTSESKGSHYPIDQAGVWVDCVKARTAVIHNDYASLPHRKGLPDGHVPVVRELVVPVFREDKIVAIVGVGNKESDYDENDLKTMTQMADLAWDITSRKRAEETLRESEEKWRTLVQDMPDYVSIHDTNGNYIFLNHYAEGFNEKDVLGRNINEFVSEDAKLIHQNAFRKVIEEKKPQKIEFTAFGDNRSIRHYESFLVPLIQNDVVTNILARATDITERKRAEEALRESEERFRKIFEDCPVGMVLTTSEMKFYKANSAFCQMLGYTLEEMTNVTFLDVTHPDYRETDKKNIEKLWQGEIPIYRTEKHYIAKNGDIRWGNVSASLIKGANGKPIYALAMVEDITERKRTELIIQKQNKELQELNDTKDKFLSIISHDLKTPFLGFLGLTKDISRNASNISAQELTELGKTMHESADNLFQLLQNLLEWTQIQRGSIDLLQKDILLTDMIAKNVKLITERSAQKGISIINLVTVPIQAYADEKMINSVLLNLLSNAVKFTHQGGVITVSAKKTEEQMIEISIRDTGIGMPKSLMERLFKVGEKTSRKGTDGELSTGLGLLLCKEFVDRNGGKIWVESEERRGSIFNFTVKERGNSAD
jgi:PAS domain S-box-containing protein